MVPWLGTHLGVVVETVRVQLLRGELGPELDLHQARESLYILSYTSSRLEV